MKVVLTPVSKSKGTSPGYLHCVYCDQFRSNSGFSQGMCPACSKRNDQLSLDATFKEGFTSVHEKLDIILGILEPKPAKTKKVD